MTTIQLLAKAIGRIDGQRAAHKRAAEQATADLARDRALFDDIDAKYREIVSLQYAEIAKLRAREEELRAAVRDLAAACGTPHWTPAKVRAAELLNRHAREA